MAMRMKMSGSKKTNKKMIKFKNIRNQEGHRRGNKFNYDMHRCPKSLKMSAA
jgi:hypothetical protein